MVYLCLWKEIKFWKYYFVTFFSCCLACLSFQSWPYSSVRRASDTAFPQMIISFSQTFQLSQYYNGLVKIIRNTYMFYKADKVVLRYFSVSKMRFLFWNNFYPENFKKIIVGICCHRNLILSICIFNVKLKTSYCFILW